MWDNTGGLSTGSFLLFIVGTIGIVALAYYVTYLISRGATKGAQSKTIKVLDSRALSKDKLICVIEVANKAYLVAMSDGGVSLLDTLDKQALEQLRAGEGRMMPAFSGILQKGLGKAFESVMERRRQSAEEPIDLSTMAQEGEEEEEQPHLQEASEADDLDEMYRKLRERRIKKESSQQGGDEK